MKVLLSFLFNFLIISAFSQSIEIKGNIKGEDGQNYPTLSVTLKQVSDSTLLAFAFSDENGNYKLTYSGDEKEMLLTVAGMAIATQTKKIENKSQTVNFKVKDDEIQLKEVIVLAPKISYKKDTLNYRVSAFSDEKDFVIGDVLKKMPGLEVSSSGQISYQGKTINRFYIENLDMLGGRYGIATNNIPAKDVATVQVYENHQPIKAMDSIKISDQAAINLRLKDAAKGTFSIMAQLGIGASPLLWNSELTGMYFAKNKQHISTYKTNNAGEDLTRELRSFGSDFNLTPDRVTNVQRPSPPDIAQNRYLFNNSHAVTVNNLFKTGENKELTMNLIYYNDYEKRTSNEHSAYFITGDSILNINEDIRSFENTNRLEGELRYVDNAETHYTNNVLNMEGIWEKDRGIIVAGNEIGQHLYRPSMKIQNYFSRINRSGESGYELHSRTGFITSPQYLTVSPGLYPDLINRGEDYSELKQDARANTFVSRNSFILLKSLMLGKIRINPTAGFNLEINRLNSELYPTSGIRQQILVPDSMKNQLTRTEISSYIGITADYRIRRLKINAFLPVNYHYYLLNNRINEADKETLQKLNFEPSVNIQYTVNQKIDISAATSIFNQMNSIYELYGGYLLSSYRYISRYEGNFAELSGAGVSLSASYKNIIKMLFINGKISYNQYRNSVIYVRNFSDNLLLTSALKRPNTRSSLLMSGKISKGFDFIRFGTDFGVSYGLYSSQQIRQDKLVEGIDRQTVLSCRLNATPVSFLIVSYSGVWQNSVSKIAQQQSYPAIRSLNNTLNMDFILPKGFRIGGSAEHYYNSAIEGQKYLYFGNLSAGCTLKQIQIELAWNNIFDTKYYTIAYYDNLNEYHYNYTIRPANVMLKVKFKLR